MGLTLDIIVMMQKSINKKSGENLGSVMDLGSQDLHCNNKSYKEFFGKEYDGELIPPPEGKCSAKIAYDAMGFSHYECIDMDGAHGAHSFDLNFNIKEKYGYEGTFDLVYNGGTSEHCFNQQAFFENSHNLCKTGGMMFHVVPIHGGVNHGFINYHPMFFARLAHINGYSIEMAWFYSKDGYRLFEQNAKKYLEEFRVDYDDPTCAILFCIALKKNKDISFSLPYQVSNEDYPAGWHENIISEKYQTIAWADEFKNNNLSKHIAIFGCGEASAIATHFANNFGLTIECYIDDFKVGMYLGKAIVNRSEFADIYSKKNIEIVLIGPDQKGDYQKNMPVGLSFLASRKINFL
jgi:hypothetical protein